MRQGCPSQGDTEQVLASSAQSLLGHCPLTRRLRRPRRVNRSPPDKGAGGRSGKGAWQASVGWDASVQDSSEECALNAHCRRWSRWQDAKQIKILASPSQPGAILSPRVPGNVWRHSWCHNWVGEEMRLSSSGQRGQGCCCTNPTRRRTVVHSGG